MAKSSKQVAIRARSVARSMGPAEFSERQAKQLRSLTERFFVLREQLSRDAVETIREMGELLERGAELLPRGFYGRWVDEALGLGRSAAKNYRRVARLGQTTPSVFVEHKDLGPSKMIRLSRVEVGKRKTVLRQKLRGKTVAEMTDAEFALVLKKYVTKTRKVTGNMRVHGLRMKVQAMTVSLHQALAYPRAENSEMRAGLRGDIAALVRAAKAMAQKAC